MEKYDLIVIGGGASGLMAAGVAAENGRSVLILEKNNNLGEKLKITGGGRCNITNAEEDERVLLKKYGSAEPYLYSPFSIFGVKDTFNFFNKLGLPIVVKENKRAFPKSERAIDVYSALERYLRRGNVKVITGANVTKINSENNLIKSVVANNLEYVADKYILATGGVSHPETGSTGDGFKWLKDLGHNVVNPTPNIVPISVLDSWVRSLAGVSIQDAKIVFYVDDVKSLVIRGRILFTHFGISGPTVLNSANKVSNLLHEGVVTAKMDLFPVTDLGALEKNILTVFDNNKNKDLKNIVKDFVPEGLAAGVTKAISIGVDVNKKVHSISKLERKFIVQILKSMPMKIDGLMGFDMAVVSDGGIVLDEIDLKTMQSRKISNFYITGDLLNISRPSGGYSLQLCWTTGYIAGKSV